MSSSLPKPSHYPWHDQHEQVCPQCQLNSQDLLHAFARTTPPWVTQLMRWRHQLVSCFGLKTGTPEKALPSVFKVGDQLGIFTIISLMPDTVVLGEDDQHLDFRVVLRVLVQGKQSKLQLQTWVRPHHVAGRCYLRLVLPFHWLICRVMLKRMAQYLAEKRAHE